MSEQDILWLVMSGIGAFIGGLISAIIFGGGR